MDATAGLKRCNRCHEFKELAEFSRDRTQKDGFCNRCKKCQSEMCGHHYRRDASRRIGIAGLKKCSRCHELKEFKEFYYDRTKKDGYANNCKRCQCEIHRLQYEKIKNMPSNEEFRVGDYINAYELQQTGTKPARGCPCRITAITRLYIWAIDVNSNKRIFDRRIWSIKKLSGSHQKACELLRSSPGSPG